MESNVTQKIKVIIASEQFLYRLGLKTIISAIGVEPELFEINDFESIKSCLVQNSNISYLVVSDSIVPHPKDSSLTDISEICPQCKILLIGNDKIDNCPCTNYALNVESQKEMVERFQEFFFEPENNSFDTESISQLSNREIDVLKAVAKGYSNKEIADQLFISTNTVITHRKNITDKLGIKTIAGLTVYAIMHNIINPEDVKA